MSEWNETDLCVIGAAIMVAGVSSNTQRNFRSDEVVAYFKAIARGIEEWLNEETAGEE